MRSLPLFRNSFTQALFLSFILLLIPTIFVSFRLPLKNTTAIPSINFLGSLLGPYDTQRSDGSRPVVHGVENKNLLSSLIPRLRLIGEAGDMRPSATRYFAPAPKQTLPVMPAPLPGGSVPSAPIGEKDNFEHQPLKLTDYDRY